MKLLILPVAQPQIVVVHTQCNVLLKKMVWNFLTKKENLDLDLSENVAIFFKDTKLAEFQVNFTESEISFKSALS